VEPTKHYSCIAPHQSPSRRIAAQSTLKVGNGENSGVTLLKLEASTIKAFTNPVQHFLRTIKLPKLTM
jgi:hypothetical protein